MPTYLVKNNSKGSFKDSNQPCLQDCSIDRNSAIFFNNLATKLLEMSQSIETRITELENRPCSTETKGVFFAAIETPSMTLGVKYEYIEYIKRYGPPSEGKFDEQKLNSLRIELGIQSENYNI
jgi:hypothetical protein